MRKKKAQTNYGHKSGLGVGDTDGTEIGRAQNRHICYHRRGTGADKGQEEGANNCGNGGKPAYGEGG